MHFINITHLPSQKPIKVTIVLTLKIRKISKVRWLKGGRTVVPSWTSQKPVFSPLYFITMWIRPHNASISLSTSNIPLTDAVVWQKNAKIIIVCGFRVDLIVELNNLSKGFSKRS